MPKPKLMKHIFLFTLLFCLIKLNAQEITFENIIIDNNASGHREITDIDGDGLNDIVAVNHDLKDRHQIVWYRYPSWERNVIANVDAFPDFQHYRSCDMEVADLNMDGYPDILGRIGLNNDLDGVICWFEHPGKRKLSCSTLWERHDVGETEYIKDFEVRDFNQDGSPDIVARSNINVYLYFRKGGSWQMKTIPVHPHEGMEAADLDGDGDEDIVLNGFWLENTDDPIGQDWPEHNIDEKWYKQNTRSWQDNNVKVSVADMNLDGRLDVLLAHSEKPGYPVSWYAAPVDPETDPWTEHVIGWIDKCHNLKVADFDLDGDPDVMAGTLPNLPSEAPHHFGIYINQQHAQHWKWQELSELGNYSAQVGDIDNDGDMDIIGLRNYNRPPIELWRNLSADQSPDQEKSDTLVVPATNLPDNILSLDKWTYIQVDNTRTRFAGRTSGDGYRFGLAMGDLSGNGELDIASGRWVYKNPGGGMDSKWERHDLGDSLDALLILNVDNDEKRDLIAVKCNRQYWIEVMGLDRGQFIAHPIGSLPVCNHGTSTQGYNLAQIIPGGRQEILLNAEGVYCLIIPEDPTAGEWPSVTLLESGSNGEWLSAGDIDGDGDQDVCLFLQNPKEADRDINRVAWLENPGTLEGQWNPHVIGGTNHHGDKVIPADVNGDGRLDLVVTEELWPGLEPDASMYWFEAPENPIQWNWNRHPIVTQYSMNNLDVADLDTDGDPDIVTCEHKGPAEQLQVWENDGKGNFSLHILDKGKESHAGARLADLDRDGDLDIVSIAWNDFEYLHVWRNDAIQNDWHGRSNAVPLGFGPKGDHRFSLPVSITAAEQDFINKVVEIDLDLEKFEKEINDFRTIDAGSLRVFETDESGEIIDETVLYQYERDPDNARKGKLVFQVGGRLSKGSQRFFKIMMGAEGGYFIHPVFIKKVDFDDHILHQGQRSYRIKTPGVTYLYHRNGAGFASLIDPEGHDWISYRPGGGSAGEFRGIPNIRPGGFHPGYENLTSRVIHSGPVKLTFESESEDKKWSTLWEVYPDYATMTLQKKDTGNYWLLYEGTPAGELDVDRDYWVQSNGFRRPVSLEWSGVLPDPEWVWFGDGSCSRVLYLAKHEYDQHPDQFWQMQGNMTVFGFGRKPHESPGTYMEEVPVHLTIGLIESKDYNEIKSIISSAVNKPIIEVGKIQRLIQ
jgi:hypothetical protein